MMLGNRRIAVLLALALSFFVAGCDTSPDFRDPNGSGPATLGELVYRILKGNLEESATCPGEYVEALETNHTDFVTTFDYALSNNIKDDLPDILGGTIQPVVESGDLPELVDALAEALALLISDEFDADREVLTSLADLATTRTMLESSMAITLVNRLLADPTLPDKVHALAGLAAEHDGVDYALDELLEMVSRNLSEEREPSECSGLALDDLEDTLLRTEGFREAFDMGAPAYVARMDANGNPIVRLDPVRGALPLPFADKDHNGKADVNDDGQLIDSKGEVIEVTTLGTGEGYGADGRALNPNGGVLYEYDDAKRMGLSWALQIFRDALEADVHHDLVGATNAALGRAMPCSDGTTTCYSYPSDKHVLADLAHLILEIGKYDRALAFVDTMSVIVNDNPALADRLFVQLGHVIDGLYTTDLSITDPALIETGIDLMPMMEAMFATSNGSAVSTPRLLMQTLHDLGETADAFPTRLGYLIDYRKLVKSPACTNHPPNLTSSIAVDYDEPRYYLSYDNRSVLEQVIELLEVADCGDFGVLGGGSLAYNFLELMADQDPVSVCNLIDDFMSILGFTGSFGEATVSGFITVFSGGACDGGQIYDALSALDGLAKSGGLDAMLPLAKVFKDQGQLDLLIELLRFVADDLQLDEDADPATQSVVRRLEPALSEMIASGAVDTMFDVLDILVTVPASDGDGTLADVMIDSIARAVEMGTVETRTGAVADTSLALETLEGLHTLVIRLEAADGADDLRRLLEWTTSHLRETRVVSGKEQLKNPNLRPLLGMLLDVAEDAGDLPHAQYLCYMDEFQQGTSDFLLGRDFATFIRLGELLETSASGPAMEDWLTSALRPQPDAPETELYGPLMQLAVAALGSDFADADLGGLLRWLAAVSDQRHGDARELVGILDDILASDENQAMLNIGRSLLAPGPLESGERPISTMADTFIDVAEVNPSDMCGPTRTEITAADMEDVLAPIVSFLQDDEGGIGAVWRLVGKVKAAPQE
jgi:hypothetical protein